MEFGECENVFAGVGEVRERGWKGVGKVTSQEEKVEERGRRSRGEGVGGKGMGKDLSLLPESGKGESQARRERGGEE